MTLPHTLVRFGGPILLTTQLIAISLAVSGSTGVESASEPPVQQPTTRIETQTLMKRIAEALDGHRTGREAFVVAKRERPHIVYGVFDTAEEAAKAARLVASRPDIFGPFMTIPDRVGLVGCVHRGATDMTRRSDGPTSTRTPSSYCPGPLRVARDQVDSIIVTVHIRSGQPVVLALPSDADALFLSSAALDKFAIPYYSRLYGPDSAAAMRREMLGIR